MKDVNIFGILGFQSGKGQHEISSTQFVTLYLVLHLFRQQEYNINCILISSNVPENYYDIVH